MVAPRSVAPGVFKKLLEKKGFRVIDEDMSNWVMAAGEKDVPFTVPKLGDLVALDLMMNVLDKAKIDNGTYLGLLAEIEGADAASLPN